MLDSNNANYTLIVSTLILFLTMTIIGVQVQRDKIIFEESKVKVVESQEKLNKLKQYLENELNSLSNSTSLKSLEYEIDKIIIKTQDSNFSSSFAKERLKYMVKRLNLTVPPEIEVRLESRNFIDKKILFLVFNNIKINETEVLEKGPTDCELSPGEIIKEGDSKKYYDKKLANAMEFCNSEIRVCENGILSGSHNFNTCFSGYEEEVIQMFKNGGIINFN